MASECTPGWALRSALSGEGMVMMVNSDPKQSMTDELLFMRSLLLVSTLLEMLVLRCWLDFGSILGTFTVAHKIVSLC